MTLIRFQGMNLFKVDKMKRLNSHSLSFAATVSLPLITETVKPHPLLFICNEFAEETMVLPLDGLRVTDMKKTFFFPGIFSLCKLRKAHLVNNTYTL